MSHKQDIQQSPLPIITVDDPEAAKKCSVIHRRTGYWPPQTVRDKQAYYNPNSKTPFDKPKSWMWIRRFSKWLVDKICR